MTWAATTSFSDLAVEEDGPSERMSQSRRVRALSMVSAVVKVLETTTTCNKARAGKARTGSGRGCWAGGAAAAERANRSAAAGGAGARAVTHQRGLRVEALQGAGDVDGVNVGKEAEAAALGGGGSVALVAQGLEDEFGAEVGAADADGHDVREGLAGNAGALAAANSVGECLHAIQHGVHVGHNVLAVHSEGGALGRAERSVCHGAVLRDVEVLAAEHGGNLALKACGAGKVVELAHGLDSDPLAAVVKHDAGVLCKHGDAPVLVLRAATRGAQECAGQASRWVGLLGWVTTRQSSGAGADGDARAGPRGRRVCPQSGGLAASAAAGGVEFRNPGRCAGQESWAREAGKAAEQAAGAGLLLFLSQAHVEKIAQVGGPDGLGMRLQGGPLGGGPDAGSPSGRCGCCGGHAAFVAGSVLSDARPAAVEAGRGADGVASRRKLCDAPDARKRICPAQQRFPSAGHS